MPERNQLDELLAKEHIWSFIHHRPHAGSYASSICSLGIHLVTRRVHLGKGREAIHSYVFSRPELEADLKHLLIPYDVGPAFDRIVKPRYALAIAIGSVASFYLREEVHPWRDHDEATFIRRFIHGLSKDDGEYGLSAITVANATPEALASYLDETLFDRWKEVLYACVR